MACRHHAAADRTRQQFLSHGTDTQLASGISFISSCPSGAVVRLPRRMSGFSPPNSTQMR